MSRKALFLTALLAVLLASAAVAMCYAGNDDSSSEPVAALGSPMAPPAETGGEVVSQVAETAEPPRDGPSCPCPPDARSGKPPAFPQGKAPEGPQPADEPPRGPVPDGKRPVMVIDASGRPHSPEEILEEYSVIYEEKVLLEKEGNEVVIYDAALEKEAGEELAGVLNTLLGGSITSTAPEGGSVVVPDRSSRSADPDFLLLVLKNTKEGSWVNSLVCEMLDEQLRTSPAYMGMVPPDTRQVEVPDPPPERPGEDDDNDNGYVSDVPYTETSSESYLVEHWFDGGALF